MIALVFSYEVRDAEEFERAYGPEGDWVHFFCPIQKVWSILPPALIVRTAESKSGVRPQLKCDMHPINCPLMLPLARKIKPRTTGS